MSFNFSFRNFDQTYLKAFQHSGCIENPVKLPRWSIFCELVNDFLAINYFRERTSSYKVNWVLSTPLILSSNVIWHAYRLIVETKISKLGVSLICLLQIKEEWIGKKVYYRKIYYFRYREFWAIFTINDHISDYSIQINIKFTIAVHDIWLYMNISYYPIWYILYMDIYIYIYVYIYIYIIYGHLYMII